MTRIVETWARPLGGVLVLMLGLTFAAPPSATAEPITAPPAKTPLTTSANAKVATIKVPPRALAQAAPAASAEGKGFFKSKAGVAAIILMAAGTSYMVYSAIHDNNPVHSPVR